MKHYLSKIQFTKLTFFIFSLIFGIFFHSVGLIAISGSLGVLVLFERYIKIKIPSSISIIFVLFIIFSLVLGSYFSFYEKYLWWDDLLHGFYGGAFAFIGYLIIQIFSYKRGISNDILIICLFSFCFSVTFGVMWEIYEFTYDTLFDGNMQRVEQGTGVTDTMHDLIIESTTALITNIYIYAYLKAGEQNWVGRLTKSFKKINNIQKK